MSVFVSAPKAKQAFVLHCLLQPDAAIALDNMDMIFTTGGGANFAPTSSDYCGQNDSDAAISGDIDDEEESKMEILVEGEGTLTFWWKVDSEAGCDELQFIADGSKEDDAVYEISGTVGWQQKTYEVTSSGTHTFLWQYVKDGSTDDGEDCGWVDYVQWTGSSSGGGTTTTYTYDPSGRRIEKDVDGDTTTYVYDGGNVIAEYNDAGSLSKKFIHGAGVDEPVCMIDVENSNAVYYYHYDGLGSVVALSNSSGNSFQSYVYSAYGQVAASDPNFTANPYLFTGRRFDYETGLYYYRARYYNPYIGRFLQTDPVGYEDGMNWYAYCGNNPLGWVDPSGCFYGDINNWYPGGLDMNDVNDSNGIWNTIAELLDSNWWDCMGKCIEDNDPIQHALEAAVTILVSKPIKKTTALKLAKLVGDDKTVESIRRGIRWGKSPDTNLLATTANALKAHGKGTAEMRGMLHGMGDYASTYITGVMTAYGLAMLAVETHCLAYCTSAEFQKLPYSKEDASIKDTIINTYFSDW